MIIQVFILPQQLKNRKMLILLKKKKTRLSLRLFRSKKKNYLKLISLKV